MPTYQYRREDGTTFEIRQSFSDAPLEVDPQTGQRVHRVIQASGIIFKGSGFYVTDNKGSSRVTATNEKSNGNGNGHSDGSENGSSETKSEPKSDTKAESTTSTKTETAVTSAAAD